MGFLSAFKRLTRFEHAIMLAIAVLIGETIAFGKIPEVSLLIILSLLVPITSEMGSFALNDYLDVETDRINKREDRPIVTGEISAKLALCISLISIILSIVFSYFINIYAFWITVIFNIFAIAYNYKLKDMPAVGNMYIGLTMAIPFIFGSAVVNNSLTLSPTIITLFVMAFIAGFAREMIKSVEDMEGDKKARKSRTLPIIIGEKNARIFAGLIYLIFVPLALTPFYFGLKQNLIGMALVVIADLGILFVAYTILKSGERNALKKARNFSLLFLFIGLVGLLIASVS